LFPIIVALLDYMTWRSYKAQGGALVNFWLTIIGVGILVLGLPFLVANPILMHAQQVIQTASGNTIIQSYNTTISMGKATMSYALMLGELLVFPQFAYSLLMLLYVFSARKRKRYE